MNQQAHEYNMDAAYREIERRAAQGENMDGAYIDEVTYQILFENTKGGTE